MSFQNKVVIVAGATGALGRIVTREFIGTRAKIVALYRSKSRLKELESDLPRNRAQFDTIQTDVTDESSIQSMVDTVLSRYGRIDVLVNLVGGFMGGVPIANTEEQQVDYMLSLNLKSTFLTCKNIFPIMQKQRSGCILNVGSRAGLSGTSGMAAYSLSKAAVINLTQALAEEGLVDNVQANVVMPSIIDTSANRNAMPKADHSKWVSPESIAALLLFLSSEDARNISGATIPIYGKS